MYFYKSFIKRHGGDLSGREFTPSTEVGSSTPDRVTSKTETLTPVASLVNTI